MLNMQNQRQSQRKKRKKIRIDKYSKIEPKVPVSTLVFIASFVVLITVLLVAFQPSNQERVYTSYNLIATSDFTEDHPFHKVAYKSGFLGMRPGLERIINRDELVFVYIGMPECPACQTHIGPFQRYFFEEGIDDLVKHIYYFNPVEEMDHFDTFRNDHASILGTTPQLVVFQNGEVLKVFTPTRNDEQGIRRSVRDFYRDVLAIINEDES